MKPLQEITRGGERMIIVPAKALDYNDNALQDIADDILEKLYGYAPAVSVRRAPDLAGDQVEVTIVMSTEWIE